MRIPNEETDPEEIAPCYHISVDYENNKLRFIIDCQEKYSCSLRKIPINYYSLNLCVQALKNNHIKETINELRKST